MNEDQLEVLRQHLGDRVVDIMREKYASKKITVGVFADIVSEALVDVLRGEFGKGVYAIGVRDIERYDDGFEIGVAFKTDDGNYIAWVSYRGGHVTPESVYRLGE